MSRFSLSRELELLAALRETGALTGAEFKRAKHVVLSTPASTINGSVVGGMMEHSTMEHPTIGLIGVGATPKTAGIIATKDSTTQGLLEKVVRRIAATDAKIEELGDHFEEIWQKLTGIQATVAPPANVIHTGVYYNNTIQGSVNGMGNIVNVNNCAGAANSETDAAGVTTVYGTVHGTVYGTVKPPQGRCVQMSVCLSVCLLA